MKHPKSDGHRSRSLSSASGYGSANSSPGAQMVEVATPRGGKALVNPRHLRRAAENLGSAVLAPPVVAQAVGYADYQNVQADLTEQTKFLKISMSKANKLRWLFAFGLYSTALELAFLLFQAIYSQQGSELLYATFVEGSRNAEVNPKASLSLAVFAWFAAAFGDFIANIAAADPLDSAKAQVALSGKEKLIQHARASAILANQEPNVDNLVTEINDTLARANGGKVTVPAWLSFSWSAVTKGISYPVGAAGDFVPFVLPATQLPQFIRPTVAGVQSSIIGMIALFAAIQAGGCIYYALIMGKTLQTSLELLYSGRFFSRHNIAGSARILTEVGINSWSRALGFASIAEAVVGYVAGPYAAKTAAILGGVAGGLNTFGSRLPTAVTEFLGTTEVEYNILATQNYKIRAEEYIANRIQSPRSLILISLKALIFAAGTAATFEFQFNQEKKAEGFLLAGFAGLIVGYVAYQMGIRERLHRVARMLYRQGHHNIMIQECTNKYEPVIGKIKSLDRSGQDKEAGRLAASYDQLVSQTQAYKKSTDKLDPDKGLDASLFVLAVLLIAQLSRFTSGVAFYDDQISGEHNHMNDPASMSIASMLTSIACMNNYLFFAAIVSNGLREEWPAIGTFMSNGLKSMMQSCANSVRSLWSRPEPEANILAGSREDLLESAESSGSDSSVEETRRFCAVM